MGSRAKRNEKDKLIGADTRLGPAPEESKDEALVPILQAENEITLSAYFRLLRENREFRLYVMSFGLTVMSEYMTLIATISMIVNFQGQRKHNLYITGLTVIKQVTAVFSSLFVGGALADSRDRRVTMMVLDFISVFVALGNFVALFYESIPGVYLVVACYQFIYGLYEPSRGALLPSLFTADRVRLRMALVITTTLMQGVMAPLGSIFGGLLITYSGLKVIFALDSFTFLLSALLLSMMREEYFPQGRDPTDSANPSEWRFVKVIRMIREGIAYCHPKFWSGLLFFRGTIGFQFGAMDVLMVGFTESLRGKNISLNLAWLYFSLGLGSFAGPAANVDGRTMKATQLAGIIGILINLVGFSGMGVANALVGTIWSISFFNIIRASGGKICGVNGRNLLNKFAEDQMMGKVMSLDYLLFVLMASLGAGIAGVMGDIADLDATNATYAIAGFMVIIALFWILYHIGGHGAASQEAAEFDPAGLRLLQGDDDDDEEETKAKSEEQEIKQERESIKLLILYIAVVFVISIGVFFSLLTENVRASEDGGDNTTSIAEATATESAVEATVADDSGSLAESLSLADFGF